MKKLFFLPVLLISLFFYSSKNISAQSNGYVITNFTSEISIEKDTSLSVKETVTVNFPYEKHGIFRNIPVIYSANGRTIRTKLDLISVTDENGAPYKYSLSKYFRSAQIKIGDPDKEIKGIYTYVITYKINKVIQRFDEYDELYWNVTGSEWDTEILHSEVGVDSTFAEIINAECFAGSFGGSERLCKKEFDKKRSNFESTTVLGGGKDFTIVVALAKNSDLVFPTLWQNILAIVSDNWGYIPSLFPFLFLVYVWYKRGRDKRYIADSIYYKPTDAKERDVGILEKSHLSFVYHPIKDLTPAEAGTLIDSKVDIHDVIAEIVDLARLGFIEIRKIEKKKLLKDQIDYAFIKTKKYDNSEELAKLKNHQKYLLKELFRSTVIHKSIENAEILFKGSDKHLDEARKLLINRQYVLLSGLKNHFYEGLPVFKTKLYEEMEKESLFYEDPEKVRVKWFGMLVLAEIISGFVLFIFIKTTGNYFPFISQAVWSIPAIGFALAMPRRTPKGFSLYQQLKGLSWFLGKGKWRYEIAEKNLFIEEILPFAIALGVLKQLAKDMGELDVKPPNYFAGTTIAAFSGDLSNFQITTTNSLLSSPQGKWSGSGSWSGGSGFTGGSSGGGFGGGGGGSW